MKTFARIQKIVFPFWLPILILLTLSSCKPLSYQVVELEPENMNVLDNAVVFENDIVEISYNFWSNGGMVRFSIHNKSDSPIYIDWDKSHFIYNGYSYEYWFDMEDVLMSKISKTNSYGLSTSYYYLSSSWGVQSKTQLSKLEKMKPKRILEIPSKSKVQTQSFHLLKGPYFTCDFNFKNKRNRVAEIAFEKSTSPMVFRNYISYSLDSKCDSLLVIDNGFFASKIFNMKKKAFKGKAGTDQYCDYKGRKSELQKFQYPYYKPNRCFWNTEFK